MATLIFTLQGQKALADAKKNNAKLHIKSIAIGDAPSIASPAQTTLTNEIKRFLIFKVVKISPDEFRLLFFDKSKDAYKINEIGLFDNNNILIAIYTRDFSQIPIEVKQAKIFIMLSINIHFKKGVFELFNFIDNKDLVKRATEASKGIFKLATNSEVTQGINNSKAIICASRATYNYLYTTTINNYVDPRYRRAQTTAENILYFTEGGFDFTKLETKDWFGPRKPWGDGGADWRDAEYYNIGRNGSLLFFDMRAHDLQDNWIDQDWVAVTDIHGRWDLVTGRGRVYTRRGKTIETLSRYKARELFKSFYAGDRSVYVVVGDDGGINNKQARVGKYNYAKDIIADYYAH